MSHTQRKKGTVRIARSLLLYADLWFPCRLQIIDGLKMDVYHFQTNRFPCRLQVIDGLKMDRIPFSS